MMNVTKHIIKPTHDVAFIDARADKPCSGLSCVKVDNMK
jgi:hypothetical protein